MIAHSANGALLSVDSQVLWEDGERVFRRGWRLDEHAQPRAVLIVLPAANRPSLSTLERLTHEFELKDELDGAWAVRPLELMRNAGCTMLVLENVGGAPLDQLLSGPLELALEQANVSVSTLDRPVI